VVLPSLILRGLMVSIKPGTRQLNGAQVCRLKGLLDGRLATQDSPQ